MVGVRQDMGVESVCACVCRLVAVPQEEGPPQIQWEGESRWIAISAALLGEVGQMQVLTPSILVHQPVPEDLREDLDGVPAPIPPGMAELTQPIVMTPPPTDFLPADIIAAAKQWMTMAADRLAIAGAAHMDAFVHADKGEIIIIDVHTVPDLSQESLLLQQVGSTGSSAAFPLAFCLLCFLLVPLHYQCHRFWSCRLKP